MGSGSQFYHSALFPLSGIENLLFSELFPLLSTSYPAFFSPLQLPFILLLKYSNTISPGCNPSLKPFSPKQHITCTRLWADGEWVVGNTQVRETRASPLGLTVDWRKQTDQLSSQCRERKPHLTGEPNWGLGSRWLM